MFRKILKVLLLAFICTLFSSSAWAKTEKDKSIYLHTLGFSTHFEDREGGKEYNEQHDTIGLEFEARFNSLNSALSDTFLAGDYYYTFLITHLNNSLDEDSTFLGGGIVRKWDLDNQQDWEFGLGLVAGIQNGYPKKSEGRDADDFLVVAYPVAELAYKRVTVYGTCVPELMTSGFCLVGFKLKLHEF